MSLADLAPCGLTGKTVRPSPHPVLVAERIPPLDLGVVRRLAEIIGDTESGLIGRDIGRLLAEARIVDPGEMTKRERVFEALAGVQQRDQAANAVLRFVTVVMNPVRFINRPDAFEFWRSNLNEALAFAGFSIDIDGGVVRRAAKARTISDARAKAEDFKRKLEDRDTHPEVLRACASEIADENYFHGVFEAVKSLAERVRSMSGLADDGIPLVNNAFGRSSGLPRVAFNGLEDRTDQSEHDGYANIMRGVFGAFRNTTGHRPKVAWPMPEAVALNIMSTVTLLHDRLDDAVRVSDEVRRKAA